MADQAPLPSFLDAVHLHRAATPVWTVSALLGAAADTLTDRFSRIVVEGEVGGVTRAASGHCYFTLKDEGGTLRCVAFSRVASRFLFALHNGDMVCVRARLNIYPARGDLQLVVDALERTGQGALYERFLQLKDKLKAQGMFDADRKRSLPPWPRGIVVVTSPKAAALQDVLTTLRRRAPHVPVLLLPVPVQGDQAPGMLRAALERLDGLIRSGIRPAGIDVDLILLVRGGGALEDLWAFNDEGLAYVIANMAVPLVSGVGHETDFTIADFVADVRAATPTAAAELASPQRTQMLMHLDRLQQGLEQSVQGRLDRQGQRLDDINARLLRPAAWLDQARLQLLQLQKPLQASMEQRLQAQAPCLRQLQSRLHRQLMLRSHVVSSQLDRAEGSFQRYFSRQLDREGQGLESLAMRLELLSPRKVLQRGFGWLTDEAGQPVVRAAGVAAGQRLSAHLIDGQLELTVDKLQLNPDPGADSRES